MTDTAPNFGDGVNGGGEAPDFEVQRLKLSDAERIAIVRLDGAPLGSLREALATAPVAEDPAGSLSERLAGLDPIAEAIARARSFQVAPARGLGWDEAVPPAHAFEEDFEAASDRACEMAALMPPPVAADTLDPAPATPVAFVIAPAASTEPTVLAPPYSPTLADLLPDMDGAVDLEPEPAGARAEAPASVYEIMRAQSVEPIVTALAENARLAAEATAASHALHNLKKMLAERIVQESDAALRTEPAEAHPDVDMPAPAAAEPPDVALPKVLQSHAEGAAEGASEDEQPSADEIVPVALVAPLPEPAPAAPPAPVREAPARAMPTVAAAMPSGPRSAPAPVPPPLPAGPVIAIEAAAPPPLPKAPATQPEKASQIVDRVRREARSQPKQGPDTAQARNQPAPAKVSPKTGPAPRRVAGKVRPKPASATRRDVRHDGGRVPFDIGGFFAGFALSGAIGVVLYFVMTAS